MSERFVHTTHHLYPLVENILLEHLPRLRSLDLGSNTGQFIMNWRIAPVQVPLTHLRITVNTRLELLLIMATKPLCDTLRELHVKTRDITGDRTFRLSDYDASLCMSSLQRLTLMKPLHYETSEEWVFIDILTSPEIMPALERIHFIVAIGSSDLEKIDQSMLFNDDRNVDVHFAILLNDNQCHAELTKRIPDGSRSHPRSVASATYWRNTSGYDWSQKRPDRFSVSDLSEVNAKWMCSEKDEFNFDFAFSSNPMKTVDLISGTRFYGLSIAFFNYPSRMHVSLKSKCRLRFHRRVSAIDLGFGRCISFGMS